jgi:hypothetical protein
MRPSRCSSTMRKQSRRCSPTSRQETSKNRSPKDFLRSELGVLRSELHAEFQSEIGSVRGELSDLRVEMLQSARATQTWIITTGPVAGRARLGPRPLRLTLSQGQRGRSGPGSLRPPVGGGPRSTLGSDPAVVELNQGLVGYERVGPPEAATHRIGRFENLVAVHEKVVRTAWSRTWQSSAVVLRRSGDGFITCADGRTRWGRFGAAGVVFVFSGPRR